MNDATKTPRIDAIEHHYEVGGTDDQERESLYKVGRQIETELAQTVKDRADFQKALEAASARIVRMEWAINNSLTIADARKAIAEGGAK